MLFGDNSILSLHRFIFLGLFLLVVGLLTLLIRERSLVHSLMALELVLLGIAFLFLVHSFRSQNITGQLVLFVFLTLGGAESAIGLALVMLYYRLRNDLHLGVISDLKF